MPGISASVSEHALTGSSSQPESIPLYLPSALAPSTRHKATIGNVAELESELRYGQAMESLMDLRCQLLNRTLGNKYKAKEQPSQRAFTRFRDLQDQIQGKINAAALQYRTARNALASLRGLGDWEKTLQVLRPQDVRGMNEKAVQAEEEGEHRMTCDLADVSSGGDASGSGPQMVPENLVLTIGEGSRTLSWIWYGISKEEREKGQIDGCKHPIPGMARH